MVTNVPPAGAPPAPTAADSRRWRRRREHLSFFLLVILLATGTMFGITYVVRERAQGLIAREEAARGVVEEVRAAEVAYHERTGRYGWVEDLEGADLLSDLTVRADGDRRYVASDGYRIDVLLPHVRLGQGVIGISPKGAQHPPDPALQKRHFAIVARPLVPLETGHRMYYVDETGELFLNEGVVDDAGARMNLLPEIQVRQSQRLDTAHLVVWQRAAEVTQLRD